MDIKPLTNIVQSPAAYNDKGAPAVTPHAAAPIKPVGEPLQAESAVQQPSAAPSTEQLADTLKNINKALQTMSQNVEFSMDEDNGRAIVKVIDRETKEVIRQMPSKEALEIAKALDKVQGLLIRQQA